MKANRSLTRVTTLALAGAALIALAACAGKPPKPTPAPAPSPTASATPRPVASPAPVRAPADWRDAAQTPGTWRWRGTPEVSQAEFGSDPAAPLFVVSCARATRTVSLVVTGATSGPALLKIVTTGPARALQASAIPGPPPALGAALGAQDPLLDAIAFSRGRFMVEAPGQAPLYLPSWPEIGRAVEDCR